MGSVAALLVKVRALSLLFEYSYSGKANSYFQVLVLEAVVLILIVVSANLRGVKLL